jgi:hypothetical protein
MHEQNKTMEKGKVIILALTVMVWVYLHLAHSGGETQRIGKVELQFDSFHQKDYVSSQLVAALSNEVTVFKSIGANIDRVIIKKVATENMLQPKRSSLSSTTIREPSITIDLKDLAMKPELLAVTHESAHKLMEEFSLEELKLVWQAYEIYTALIYRNMSKLTSYPLPENFPLVAGTVANMYDESHVFEFSDELQNYGHPFENKSELFASFVNTLRNDPKSFFLYYKQYDPRIQNILHEEVTLTLLQAIGEKRGKILFGTWYEYATAWKP